ncbi:MAG: type I phosphomannose isomerase catalytic subunit [Acutalibacteraceae bacterium]|nr:type I phosphomannose isomerase catalytic subunit [Acutalibacteraceae bacterium]
MNLYPIRLLPYVSETIWGGRKLIEEYGVKTEKNNAAEGWMLSCHEAGSSSVANGIFAGRSFADVVKENPVLCGTNAKNFEDFPILIKFIDAMDNLSVQVHPTKEYCELTGKGQSKTECWYIIDCEEDASLILGFKDKLSPEEFKAAIANNTLTDYVENVKVKKGDFFFIDSGTLHAICKGILLAEVQESSNTTYRIYDYNRVGADGKPRELHVEDGAAVTKLEKYSQPDFSNPALDTDERRLLADCPLFKVWKLETKGSFSGNADENSFVSLLIMAGNGKLRCLGETLELTKGDSIFIPANAGDYTLTGEFEIIETRI